MIPCPFTRGVANVIVECIRANPPGCVWVPAYFQVQNHSILGRPIVEIEATKPSQHPKCSPKTTERPEKARQLVPENERRKGTYFQSPNWKVGKYHPEAIHLHDLVFQP